MNHSLALPAVASSPPISPATVDRSLPRRIRSILRLISTAGWVGNDGSWLARYATALAALAVATVARQLLDPALEHRAPYGVYLIAVLFVVWRAGVGPALVTVCVGVLLGRYLFDHPRGSVEITEANQASLVMSLTIGFVAVIV